MYSAELAIAPTEKPVSLTEAKTQVSVAVAITHHDDLLNRLIAAATEEAETKTGRRAIAQTWDIKLDRFPSGGGHVLLPQGPLRTVTHIKYQDITDSEQTLDAANYKPLVSRCEIALKNGKVWPATLVEPEAVAIRVVVGLGADASDLATASSNFKNGVLLLVEAYWKREFDQAFDKELAAANAIFESLRPGDDFNEYGE